MAGEPRRLDLTDVPPEWRGAFLEVGDALVDDEEPTEKAPPPLPRPGQPG